MTTDQQRLEVISQAIYEWMSYPDNNGIKSTNDIESVSKDILSALKQFDPEPLEVEIKTFDGSVYRIEMADHFTFKNDAIDFCAKHGLRVKK